MLGLTDGFWVIMIETGGHMDENPVFRFALREDLKDNKEFLPSRAENLATGWDVRSAQVNRKDVILRPGAYCSLPLGFRTFPPSGWWFNIHPRSSSFSKKGAHSLIGVVDEAFPDEARWVFQYLPDINSLGKDLVIKFGDRIAQIIPVKRVEMRVIEITNEEYDKDCTKRNAERKGGFGSTG
jgi:dUTPase